MLPSGLSIDARLLCSAGVGTYLRNILKRIVLDDLQIPYQIFVQKPEDITWVHQYQPQAQIKLNPTRPYTLAEQYFWAKNLDPSYAFWSPQFNIPWTKCAKLIVTAHDLFALTLRAPLAWQTYAGLMFARIRKKADAIIAVSEFTQSELECRAHIKPQRVTIIPNGVDPHWFMSELPPRPYPFGYLLCISDLRTYKNIPHLLKAFERTPIRQRLVIVGRYRGLPDPDHEAYHAIRQAGSRVIFAGKVSDERLRGIVKHADGLILPSLYEGFGLPPLEAMASRIPVLVSQIAALQEVCGDQALYCDPNEVQSISDGLQQLAGLSGIDRDRLVSAGFDHAAKFNWDNSVAQTLQVLKQTLD